MYTSIAWFPKDINHNTCRLFAQRAMQLNFVNVDFNPTIQDEYFVVGWGTQSVYPDIFVSIFCTPQGTSTSVAVLVTTPGDPATADTLRNAIRAQIIAATIFDPPPIHPLRSISYTQQAEDLPIRELLTDKIASTLPTELDRAKK